MKGSSEIGDTPFRATSVRRSLEPPPAPRRCSLAALRLNAEVSLGLFCVGVLSTLVFGVLGFAISEPITSTGGQLIWGTTTSVALLAAVSLVPLLKVRRRYVHGASATAKIARIVDLGLGKHGHGWELSLAFEANGKMLGRKITVLTHSPPCVGAELVVFYSPGDPTASVVAPLAESALWHVRSDEPEATVESAPEEESPVSAGRAGEFAARL